MSLSHEDVRRLATLARIELDDADSPFVRDQLNRIFGLIEQLQAVDTKGVEPMTHAEEVPLRLREDSVTESDRRELYQAVAPQVEQGLYLVPKVIE